MERIEITGGSISRTPDGLMHSADIILANPPLEFATGSGGYLCEIAREMEGITPERITV